MKRKITADDVVNALKKDPELLAEVKARLDFDPEINSGGFGALHYASATEHCAGGRNDTADWEQVNCPDCMRSYPRPRTAWAVLMVEHEFGQRDEGWTLWASQEEAQAHKDKCQGPGAPGQYFSYEGPRAYTVAPDVWAKLQKQERLSSQGRSFPKQGTTITKEHISKHSWGE